MAKSPDAFRTISEVADWLGIQAHVLRFWESKFSQVKPVKRAGGRRYYRPNDMLLLGGIRKLLHEDGLTIKGVQKILREEGISHVIALSPPLDDQTEVEEQDETPFIEVVPEDTEETGVVLRFDSGAPQTDTEEEEDEGAAQSVTAAKAAQPEPETPETDDVPEPQAEASGSTEADESAARAGTEATPDTEDTPATAAKLPAFLRRPMAEPPSETDNPPPPAAEEPVSAEAEPVEPEAPAPPRPRNIDMPPITPVADIAVSPGALTFAARTRGLTRAQAEEIGPHLEKLTALRDKMAARRKPGAHPGPID
ncbi:MerR family transcriptional regulator [Marimonas sp. MJW-29]|uniref:MerR family transcriptional regulator n=1 Tax=Sulfitobacter sediminis TaxID=3234186 RepID=A0ABV3RKS7_9RHOB